MYGCHLSFPPGGHGDWECMQVGRFIEQLIYMVYLLYDMT